MSRRSLLPVLFFSLAAITATAFAPQNQTASVDWPQWRGPNRDAVSPDTGLLKEWGPNGPPLAWKASGLGGGFSSVAIHDGRIFTMGKRKGSVQLIALALADGKELWATTVAEGGDNPNATPTVDGNLVFAISKQGDLLCADAATGKELWRKNFPKDFGGKMMSGWGYSESPLVDGDKLVCTPGAKDAAIVALNKRTGETIWKATLPEIGNRGKDGAGYSSIVVSEAGGIRQYVQLMGRGVIGVAADDGRFLWGYNRVANGTANIPTPIVEGDFVFCSTGYGTGSALLKLSRDGAGVKAEEVYFLDGKTLQNHHGGLVLVGDYIYGGHQHNQGFPVCVELKSGEIVWAPGRGPGNGSAAVVYADGHLYFRYQNGLIALIEATPEGYREKGTFEIPVGGSPSWAHPVVVGGKLYLREQGDLLVYNVRKK